MYDPQQEESRQKCQVSEEAVAYIQTPAALRRQADCPPCRYSVAELEERLQQAETDGQWLTGAELRKRLAHKYPFLCV